MNSSDEEVRPKRKRNEAEWGRNKRKKMRAEGKEYVSAKGKKLMPGEQVKSVNKRIKQHVLYRA